MYVSRTPSRRTLGALLGLAALAALCLAGPPAAAQQALYVSYQGSNTIVQFNSSGQGTTFTSALNIPSGLAFDPAGNLYAGSFNSGTITRFANTGGGVLSTTGMTFASGLTRPVGLAFDPAGSLYAGNFSGSNGSSSFIVKFTNTGGVLSSTGGLFASGLNGLYDVAADSAGSVYASAQASNSVTKYNSTGVATQTLTSGLSTPQGLAFDSAGNLFVGNAGDGSNGSGFITKFTTTGGTLSSVGATFASGLNYPSDLAFDGAGNLYTANTTSNTITKFTITSTAAAAPSAAVTFATAASGSGPAFLAFSPVPEPSSWAAFGLGALGVAGLALRSRKRRGLTPAV